MFATTVEKKNACIKATIKVKIFRQRQQKFWRGGREY